ncbi:DUF4956 domain-containing protein [Pseudobutyrivibrio sp.]|uniref:DUF4956 domain-containing protein n=1 Tax=Pseudobutyrivibrio sp. TaxID=2014367 RepID=UPI001B0A7C68|nr:DUF4956 domain-containing protein [Pseudobutyrivibrio sp.]MBO5617270.1 DUF4956 domain-containing protein [Pseudobutyrivibrio sp.]MBP3262676.1 DUF4956 domain-containing protein [Pseudobutyrivibrio sp.]
MESLLTSLLGTATAEVEITNSIALIYTVAAGFLGLLISLTYMKTGSKISKNFARTLITLPILVCVVLLVVNGNFGTSIAVLGAFSLVRFRSLQGSSRDISFIFFSMTVGIVCAVGEIILAATLTVLICGIYFVLNAIKYGANSAEEKDLRVTIPENLDYSDIFDDLFEKYTKEHKQIAVRTTNMGSMYEINYRVKLLDEKDEKKFLDDIRMRNGNLTVICGRCDVNEAEEL